MQYLTNGWDFKYQDQYLSIDQLPIVSNALPVPRPGLIAVPLGIKDDEVLRSVAGSILSAVQRGGLVEDPYGSFDNRFKCETDGLTLKKHYELINNGLVKNLEGQVSRWLEHPNEFPISDETAITCAILLPTKLAQQLMTGRDTERMATFIEDGIALLGQGVSPIQALETLRSKDIDLGFNNKELIQIALTGETAQKDLAILSHFLPNKAWDREEPVVLPPYGDLFAISATIMVNDTKAIIGINGSDGLVAVDSTLSHIMAIKTPSIIIDDRKTISALVNPEPTFDDVDRINVVYDLARAKVEELGVKPKTISYNKALERIENLALSR
jgi:hypothetical protein